MFMLAIILMVLMLDCTEYYKINNAAAGLVLTDAAFLSAKSGAAESLVGPDGKDYGYPRIKAVLGIESLVAGVATRTPGFVVLSGQGGGLHVDEDKYIVPIPWSAIGTTELGHNPDEVGRPYDQIKINMPWPKGSTLCDGVVSKAFGCGANTYQAFVLYRQFGKKATKPKGGRVVIVSYDKGGDSTTVIWNEFTNVAKNAAGELLKDHKYRLLWIGSLAEDKEINLIRVTVPGFPPLIVPACGAVSLGNATYGAARKVYFLDDSIELRGDKVHKVEGHIGAAHRPVIYIGWEDMGKF